MLKRLVASISNQEAAADRISYEQARSVLESHARDARRFLAARPDIEPEILYYLASDEAADVRRLVAANPTTPQQANKILTADSDDEVRCELARKIGRLLPQLDNAQTTRARELAIDVIERLAQDSLPRVRAVLAEEIKTSPLIPPHLAKTLAQDVELVVCAPILEYSPLLSDEDLIEIIAGSRVEGVMAAIARRTAVSAQVADAIVATLDVPAVAALLANANARIREETLDHVIEHATQIEAWHQPVVLRADLSMRVVRRIAGFVSAALLSKLCERSGLDEETAAHLHGRVRSRLNEEGASRNGADLDEAAQSLVDEAFARSQVDDEFVADAIERGDRRLVVCALSKLAGVEKSVVERILISQSGKAITALVWKAKLAMRTAVTIQTVLMRLSNRKLVLARDGVHFPLSGEEMAWHLGFFGIPS